jgi:hypothetical protein
LFAFDLFVVDYVCWLGVCDFFFVMMVLGGWCLSGHSSLLKETNHFKVGFGGHEFIGH